LFFAVYNKEHCEKNYSWNSYDLHFCYRFLSIKKSTDSAANYYGKKVTICSKVYGTKALKKVTFINLGAAYPNSLLTVVIFAKDRSKFKIAPDAMYNDKNICVTGIVKEYKGKPAIIVESPDQINIE
jgi:DNA/RNA endonuclease YhcR with UshA esterase domain